MITYILQHRRKKLTETLSKRGKAKKPMVRLNIEIQLRKKKKKKKKPNDIQYAARLQVILMSEQSQC